MTTERSPLKPPNLRAPYQLLAVLAMGAMMGVSAAIATGQAVGCTPAQVAQVKEGTRTVVNVAETGCAIAPIVGAIVLTDAEGKTVETVCAEEEELRPLIDQLLAARKAKALRKAKAMGLVAIPDAGTD